MGRGLQSMSSTSLMQMAMSMERRLAVSILAQSYSFDVTLCACIFCGFCFTVDPIATAFTLD